LSQSFFRRFSRVYRAAERTGSLFTIHDVAPRSPAVKRTRSHSTARRSLAAPPRLAIDNLAPGSEIPSSGLPPIRSGLGIRGSGTFPPPATAGRGLLAPAPSKRIGCSDPQVRLLGDGALGVRAPISRLSVGLHSPSDASYEELLVVRSRLLREHFQVLNPQLTDSLVSQGVDFTPYGCVWTSFNFAHSALCPLSGPLRRHAGKPRLPAPGDHHVRSLSEGKQGPLRNNFHFTVLENLQNEGYQPTLSLLDS
jgi:hypothetical protein